MTPAEAGPSDAWIALGSALLGAIVGGAASLAASVVVDRLRLRREMRVSIYDQYIEDAAAAVALWETRSRQGNIDLKSNAALLALAQVRRAAVIAGKTDRKHVQQWDDAYQALARLSIEIERLLPTGSGVVEPGARDKLLSQVVECTGQIRRGLNDYQRWLEERLT